MSQNKDKSLHVAAVFIIVLSILTSSAGLFYTAGGNAYDFVNQYGDTVKICGSGLYAHDSYFMAPIFRGTDLSILALAVPALLLALILDAKRKKLKSRLFLTSVISIFTYYSASIAFGITCNTLHPAYIALFSFSLFGFITAFGSIDKERVKKSVHEELSLKGFYVFLAFTGATLIAAWLPDILKSFAAGHLESIEIYTTQVTNVLDIGVIVPAAFICLFLLKKRCGLGFALLQLLLTMCIFVGIMVPVQTLFQIDAGISLPAGAVITKIVPFIVLALFSFFLNVKLLKNIADE